MVSALPALKPTLITDAQTGEVLESAVFHADLDFLVTTVREASKNFYSDNKVEVEETLRSYTGSPQPESFARKHGWNLANNLPKEVKAKSRVERLARYHVVQTVSSFVLNPNPLKQEPSFSKTITLGAVDTQMASMALEGNQLVLSFKCWTREYDLHFTLPDYILKRKIVKFSLPTIRLDQIKGWVFNFTVQEQPATRLTGKHVAGVDLGRVEPFTMAIVNEDGNRVAHYTTGKRLKQVNAKRERLLVEKKHIGVKIESYSNLGLDTTVLTTERNFKRSKITRMGVEVAKQVGSGITQKLAKHNVSVLNMEDLRWVTGAKYGSKWNHSMQQEAVTHSLRRKGIATKKVNPKNTSQDCQKCSTKLIHNTKKRTVWCVECKTVLDRDFNASMNIAKNKNKNYVSPLTTGSVGVTVAEKQVTTSTKSSSVLSERVATTATFLT